MKRYFKIFILFLFLLGAGFSFAQQGRDRVEALRVAFISKKLELTTSESEKLWPVYNEYNDKVKAIRKNLRHSYKAKAETMTEKDAEELYILELQSRQAETDIHKQYAGKIKNIIGVKKLAKLRIAEEEFKREVFKTIKEGGGD